MNVLIIGNGFDIAHGLPTTYRDFLDFIEQIQRIPIFSKTVNAFESLVEQTEYNRFSKLNSGVAHYIDNIIRDDKKPNAAVKDLYETHPNEIIEELIRLSENNIWIKWFNKTGTQGGWIDFELEISKVLQHFDFVYIKFSRR